MKKVFSPCIRALKEPVMDRIEITIEQESVDDGAIFIMVQINGNDLPGILNVEAFFAIKQENELVPLFTCGCGDFGCGGYYVNVSCNETDVILRNGYHRFNQSLESAFEYQLDWPQVRDIAEEILTYLEKIHERNPKAYITSGYGGENLVNRLPNFRKSFLLVSR
jgi:hypothetical protein